MTNWKKLGEVPDAIGRRKVLKKVFQLPDGRESEYVVKDEGVSVCIVALTQDRKIVLARQFRPGPEKMLLELPGGGIETGETSIEAARRELLEETGYTGDVVFMGAQLNCAYSNRVTHAFVATDCKKIQDQSLDENEFIDVVEMPLEEFRDHIRSGDFTDVKSAYLALDHLGML